MTRKIKFIIATLFTTGLLFLFPSHKAYADDASSVTPISQPISDLPTSIVDTSTVTVQTVQTKIDAAVSSLQSTSQANGDAIISSIQANVPNTDTNTAISIATTQQPIATAVADATDKIQIAQQTIDSATIATQVAQTTIAAVDSQTAVVANAQSVVDTETATSTNAQVILTNETNKLPDLQGTQTTTESGFYTENSNLGTATSNVDLAQSNLINAQLDLTNNGTITVTTNGVTATVYRATNGAAPVIANQTPVEVIRLSNIAANWGSGQILNSGLSDHVIVKYEGTITVPSDAVAVKYAVSSDDGSKMYVDGNLAISNWRDQGTSWSQYSPIYDTTTNKSQDFIIWYYENGGGASCTLGWMIFRADGSGYFTTPGASAFGTTTTTQDPVKVAAVNDAQTNLTSSQSAYDAQLIVRDSAYQAWQNAIHAVNAQQSVIDAAQAAYDAAQTNLTNAQQNLTTEQQNLTAAQNTAQVALQTANSLADAATVAVQDANVATGNAVTVTQDYYAKIAADKATAETLAAQQSAVAAKAAADKAAAEAALAAQQKADAEAKAAKAQALDEQAAKNKAEADAAAVAQQIANEKAAADAKAAEDARIVAEQAAKEAQAAADKAKADAEIQAAKDAQAATDAAKAKADAKAKAESDAKLEAQKAADEASKKAQEEANAKAAADAAKAEADKIAADQAAKEQQAKDAKAKEDAAIQTQKDAQAKADVAKAEADKLAAQQAADKKAAEDKTIADKAAVATIGVVPNNPSQLSDTVVKQAPAEILVPHIQVDVKGVENGGIQFFGTKSAPQVVGENGALTPPAPPPGSGLPIPADAITTSDTFIGQPGGTSFNSPDIAIPVVLTPVTGALASVPGVQAVNQAFVAMANIGNDMSPVTRKKAKKILVTTLVVGQIAALRRRFGK